MVVESKALRGSPTKDSVYRAFRQKNNPSLGTSCEGRAMRLGLYQTVSCWKNSWSHIPSQM